MLTYNPSIDGGTFEESAKPKGIFVEDMEIGQRYFLDNCFDVSGILKTKKPCLSFRAIKGDLGAYHLENGTVDFPQYNGMLFYTCSNA